MRLYLAPFVAAFRGTDPGGPRTVIDLDDDEVDTRRQIAALHVRLSRSALMTLEAAEADKYRTLEGQWLSRFDDVLVCSERDRTAVAARSGHSAVHVVPNAVRRLDSVAPPPDAGDGICRLLFVGSLGYFPNVDAATVLCREVLPRLRARIRRDVRVDLVGNGPSPAVMELAGIAGVSVHPDVASVTPFYARALAAIVPLRAGGGTRLKILEAFAHGVPVVSTPAGAAGLAVVAGQHLLVAEEPDGLAEACERLLAAPTLADRLRTEALRLVATRYDAAIVSDGIRTLFKEFARPPQSPR
jgi:glycosyltransferase involved in cell wall biosynthesis